MSEQAPWLDEVVKKIHDLRHLKADWDSYGALPVKTHSMSCAIRFVRQLAREITIQAPLVGATPGGYVGFCWDEGDWSLDVIVGTTTGYVDYVYLDARDDKNDKDVQGAPSSVVTRLLTKCYKRMKDNAS